ncbi:MAG TPA: hypothetical protein VIK08_12685 [Candidatus Limnocylindrales bacterium]
MIAQLFPERLNLYGDAGNVQTLVQRAAWRGADVELRTVHIEADASEFADVDLIIAGGGPDSDQFAVARGLERLGDALSDAVRSGASLLAVCGGFQNLGQFYVNSEGDRLRGPGLLNVETTAPRVGRRMVGGVVAKLDPESPIAAIGRMSAALAGFAGQENTVVGFENHAGRSHLGPGVHALGRVPHGHGNNGVDATEGLLALPRENGILGLRVASYLHGPLLPANPHLADLLLSAALARHGVTNLIALDDRAEWAAHAANARRWKS